MLTEPYLIGALSYTPSWAGGRQVLRLARPGWGRTPMIKVLG